MSLWNNSCNSLLEVAFTQGTIKRADFFFFLVENRDLLDWHSLPEYETENSKKAIIMVIRGENT